MSRRSGHRSKASKPLANNMVSTVNSRLLNTVMVSLTGLTLAVSDAARTGGQSLATLPWVILVITALVLAFTLAQGIMLSAPKRFLLRDNPGRRLVTVIADRQVLELLAPGEGRSGWLDRGAVIELTPQGLQVWRGGTLHPVSFLPYTAIQRVECLVVPMGVRRSSKVEVILAKAARPSGFTVTPLRDNRFWPFEQRRREVENLVSEIERNVIAARRAFRAGHSGPASAPWD